MWERRKCPKLQLTVLNFFSQYHSFRGRNHVHFGYMTLFRPSQSGRWTFPEVPKILQTQAFVSKKISWKQEHLRKGPPYSLVLFWRKWVIWKPQTRCFSVHFGCMALFGAAQSGRRTFPEVPQISQTQAFVSEKISWKEEHFRKGPPLQLCTFFTTYLGFGGKNEALPCRKVCFIVLRRQASLVEHETYLVSQKSSVTWLCWFRAVLVVLVLSGCSFWRNKDIHVLVANCSQTSQNPQIQFSLGRYTLNRLLTKILKEKNHVTQKFLFCPEQKLLRMWCKPCIRLAKYPCLVSPPRRSRSYFRFSIGFARPEECWIFTQFP